jgi:predicted permease
MTGFLQDFRMACRSLARDRVFAAVAVLTLALGTGATTAIFTVVNAVLLRPLPYHDADRIVALWQTARDNPRPAEGGSVSHVNFLDWQREARSFDAMALYSGGNLIVTGFGEAEAMRGAIVTPGFFDVFGARPILGRGFTAADDRPTSPGFAVISHGLWQERFGGRRDVVGQRIEVSGTPREIIGVAPAGFDFPSRARLWMAVRNDDAACGRGCVYLDGVGRLSPGVATGSARQEMTLIARRLEQRHPADNTNVTAGLSTLQDQAVGSVRVALLVLLGAVAMVLLIACANVANLLLVRGTSKRAELAMRAALGGSRWRMLRQLLAENLVLALSGAALGLLLADWGVSALKGLAPANLPRLSEIALDRSTYLFAIGLAGACTLVFGLGPAVQLSGAPLMTLLRGRGASAHARGVRGRALLLVGEVALSLVLLAGAGLLLRSLWQLHAVDPGFDAANLTVFRVSLPSARYADKAAVVRGFEELDERFAALPGVTAVARIAGLPLSGAEDVFTVRRTDKPAPPPGQAASVLHRVVDPEYFRTLRIPVVSGRTFEVGDRAGAPPVVVISREMAARFWPGENPVGRQVDIDDGDGVRTVIGVVGDVRSQALATAPQPELYLAHAQRGSWSSVFVLRSAMPSDGILAGARSVLRQFDAKLPLLRPGTMQQLVDEGSARPAFYLVLLALFAGLAVALAAIGVYGVVAYAVGQRTQEIGVRMALGATAADVVRLVLWQGMRPALVGLAAGLAASVAAGRIIRGLLYETSPADPLTLAGVTALLVAVVLAACLVPSRRATRVPPAIALRGE